MKYYNTSSRDNFNLTIIDKQENYLVVEVMIVNPEQKFFYRGKLFFVQALWRALEKYPELEGKPFFTLITYERAWKDTQWLIRNSRKAILSFEVLNLKNYPLLHTVDENNLAEWDKVWDYRIDLPVAVCKVVFADVSLLEGFEPGMDWDAAAIDPLFAGNKI